MAEKPDGDVRSITAPELFTVRVHLVLLAREDIQVINLDLRYDWPGTSPERQEAQIAGTDVSYDAAYRLARPATVPAGELST